MTTVRDLCNAAGREIGIFAAGEAMPAQDATDAMATLNRWLDSNAAEPLQIYTITRTQLELQPNASEYLLGQENAGEPTEDGFDTGWTGAPADWTANSSGDGTITNDTTVFQAGGHSVKMVVTASGTNSIHSDFLVRSGDEQTLSVWARASFSSAGFVTVQNLDTGNYLTSAGAWQGVAADVFEADAGGSFVLETLAFDMEDSETVGNVITSVRITLRQADVTASVWFDTFSFTGTTTVPIPRPVELFVGNVRLVDTSLSPPLETPLTMLTEAAWQALPLKTLTNTRPTHWYYNPTFPFGTLTFWPVPTGSDLSAAVYVPTQVPQFTTLDDTVSLPPGYERMIVKNLALELCPSYKVEPSPLLLKQATDAIATVKRANYREQDMSFPPSALIGYPGVRTWDIKSGP